MGRRKTDRSKRAVSLDDVARHAGVTTMTVSRLWSHPDKVAKATQERIKAAIEAVGYVPDTHAARLAGKRRAIVCAIVPTLEASYFSAVLRGVADAADAADATLIIGETHYDRSRQERLIADFLGWRPDGIVHLAAPLSQASHRLLAVSRSRLVEAWEINRRPIDASVGFSNRHAARDMTTALKAAGHTAVAFAARNVGKGRALERQLGYADAIASLDGKVRVFDTQVGGSGYEAGALLMDDVLDTDRSVDAVFFAGDTLAIGAVFAARRRGVRVPEDIAVAGFGDLDAAAFVEPSLTTVRLPNQAIGRRCVEIIFDGSGANGRIDDLGYELVERGSARLAKPGG